MDYSLNKFNIMTKLEKIQEITNQILELKKLGTKVDTKRTIQQLQQELGKLTQEKS